jgi:hypothetical protein
MRRGGGGGTDFNSENFRKAFERSAERQREREREEREKGRVRDRAGSISDLGRGEEDLSSSRASAESVVRHRHKPRPATPRAPRLPGRSP